MNNVVQLIFASSTLLAPLEEINFNETSQLLSSAALTSTNFSALLNNGSWAATLIPSLAENAETGFVTSPQRISVTPSQQAVRVPNTTSEYGYLTMSPSRTYRYDLAAVKSAIAVYGSPVATIITEVDENNVLYYLTSPQLVTHSPSQPISGTTIQPPSVPSVDSITSVEPVRTAIVDTTMPESASENVKTVYVTLTPSLTFAASPTAATMPMITPAAISASASPANPTATSQTPTPTAKPPGPEKGSAAEIITAIVDGIITLHGKTFTVLSSVGTGYIIYKRSGSSSILMDKDVIMAMTFTIGAITWDITSSIVYAFAASACYVIIAIMAHFALDWLMPSAAVALTNKQAKQEAASEE